MTDPIDPEWLELLDAMEARLLEVANPKTNTPAGMEFEDDAPYEPEKWEFVGMALTERGWRIDFQPNLILFYAPNAMTNPGDAARLMN